MKRRSTTTITQTVAALLLIPLSFGHAQQAAADAQNTIKSEIVTKSASPGQSLPALLRLTDTAGQPVTLDDLRVAHTEKIHLLIIDQSLTDYHHVHPMAGDKPGEYRFDFKPRFGGPYLIWADVVPAKTGKQEYVKTKVQVPGPAAASDKTLNTTAEANGYRFSLTTENSKPLQAGKATMMKIKVTTLDGKEFSNLEPVMGAFAHMVAFPEDLESVTHVHPMGKEPETKAERGGPELSFHVEPAKPGYQKFFLQTQIEGSDTYAAFGMNVEAATTTASDMSHESTYSCPMHPEVKQKAPGKCPKCGMALEMAH